MSVPVTAYNYYILFYHYHVQCLIIWREAVSAQITIMGHQQVSLEHFSVPLPESVFLMAAPNLSLIIN